MSKKLIIVTSPPACGKTYISKELAKRLNHIVYLDKDTLITLSKQIFVVAGASHIIEAVISLRRTFVITNMNVS